MNSTIEQLRRYIDSGKTADKVAVIDPAAAPLGADEEAAGTPLSSAAITQAHETEVALGEEVQKNMLETRNEVIGKWRRSLSRLYWLPTR